MLVRDPTNACVDRFPVLKFLPADQKTGNVTNQFPTIGIRLVFAACPSASFVAELQKPVLARPVTGAHFLGGSFKHIEVSHRAISCYCFSNSISARVR